MGSEWEMWTPEATPKLIQGLKCPQEDMSIQIDVMKFPRPEEKKIPEVEQVAITSLRENLQKLLISEPL